MIGFRKLLQRVPVHNNKLVRCDAARTSGVRFARSRPAAQFPCQRLPYHSTTYIELPVRRRKRPAHRQQIDAVDSEEATFENPLKQPPVVDTAEFRKAADALLIKIENGLQPMKAQNETFILERSRGDAGGVLTLDLGAKLGKYRIEVSEEEHVFEYSSPISGKLLYVLSSTTGEWVGLDDGHNFEGLLVRDLIRYCQGMPAL